MLISDQKVLEEFCAPLHQCEFITVDTEFLREKTYYPKLCLIQISDPDGRAAAVDPLAQGIDLSPVYNLLLDKAVLKVFHAGRQDLEIFFNLTERVVTPIFDTQIAAMVCGHGDSVGYESLARNILNVQIDKSSQFTDWSRRPLSEKQLTYALGDVTHLIGVYKSLAAQLEKQGRTAWVFQEEEILNAPETYQVDPYETWKRIKIRSPKPKTLAALRELAAWREKRAQSRDLPKTWVMKDDTLADIAGQMPLDMNALKRIRNIPKDVAERKMGQEILEILSGVAKSDPAGWPKVEKKKPLSPAVSATIDILKMLLKIQCADYGVAAKLVASSDDIEAIALSDKAEVPALKGWRYEVFGRDALALKNGLLAIGLKDSKILKFDVKDL